MKYTTFNDSKLEKRLNMKEGGNPVTLVMGRIALAFFRMLQLRYRLRG